MAVTPEQFAFIRDHLDGISGIYIPEDKLYLIDTRLMPVIRKHELEDLDALIAKLKIKDDTVTRAVLEAMTTNETFFFRDTRPFDTFKKTVMPRIKDNNNEGVVRIWCAACSSGQEPYSLAMLYKEQPDMLAGKRLEIVATDIDTTILQKAKDGIYSQFEVQRGLPIQLLMKYFTQLEAYGDKWQIKDEIRHMIQFKQLNLMAPYLGMGHFDFIFCRNVLIYFQPHVKTQVLEKLCGNMKSHALLMLGASETVTSLTDKLSIFEGQQGLFAAS